MSPACSCGNVPAGAGPGRSLVRPGTKTSAPAREGISSPPAADSPSNRAEALPRVLRQSLYGSGHRPNVYARVAEFRCGQPRGWSGRFGEQGSTATRLAAKTTAGHRRGSGSPPCLRCRPPSCRSRTAQASAPEGTRPGVRHVGQQVPRRRGHSARPGHAPWPPAPPRLPRSTCPTGLKAVAGTVLTCDDLPPHLEVRTLKDISRA